MGRCKTNAKESTAYPSAPWSFCFSLPLIGDAPQPKLSKLERRISLTARCCCLLGSKAWPAPTGRQRVRGLPGKTEPRD